MGLIESNPVRGVEKPRAGRRELVISQGEFERILCLMRDEEFRDVLVVSWETGCRPQEVLAVEARHFEFENGCWVFSAEEAKGKKRPRVVYLTDNAVEITKKLSARFPTGPLFRNTDGVPWNPFSLNCRFRRLQLTLGRIKLAELGLIPPRLKRLKKAERNDPARRDAHTRAVLARRKQIAELARHHGPKYSLYTFRHSWCTHALARGIDAVTVSVLMGHRDTTMISRVYSHLMERRDHLREAVRKVVRTSDA
jgi:integrase